MPPSPQTTPVKLILKCEGCWNEWPDDCEICPECFSKLRIRVHSESFDVYLEDFYREALGHTLFDLLRTILAELAIKSSLGQLYLIARNEFVTNCLDQARNCLNNGEFDRAFQLSTVVLSILPEEIDAQDIQSNARDSLVAELLSQARISDTRDCWKKSTPLCNRILELDADNAEARELLRESHELQVRSILEHAQQQLDALAYDSALQSTRDALEIIPGHPAAQILARVIIDHRISELLSASADCCLRKDWTKANALCYEALGLRPGDVAAMDQLKRKNDLQFSYLLAAARTCLTGGQIDESIAIYRDLLQFPRQSEACAQLCHDICIACIVRSEAAISTDDWQKALTFAQKGLELEPGNSDAVRLCADVQAKIHLKDLAARAFAAYKSKDLTGCRNACEAFLSYQRECGVHVEFTDASNSVIDFGKLPGKLKQDINTDRMVKVLLVGQRLFKWAVPFAVVALLIFGIGHWRKAQFAKLVHAFDTAMQNQSFDAAKTVAPKIADKYTPADNLLAYFRSRESFETALNVVNTGLLQQYGPQQWANLQSQKQAAEAGVGNPDKGIDAYKRAMTLLAECQTLADAGEKARKDKEASEKALSEKKARELREQAERKRAQETRISEQLRERVRKDVNYVAANMNQNKPMGNAVEELSAASKNSWREATDNGWGEGQILMGLSYQFGIHVIKDPDKGRDLIRKAADQGIGLAEFCMALDIDTRRHPESCGEKIAWMKRAAEHGVAQAQTTLGGWYLEGYGNLPKDYDEAAKWLKIAADSGNATAQYQLGACYFNGLGVAKDLMEAVKLIRRSAENGEPSAQYNLAGFYRVGNGVVEDLEAAFEWDKKAAAQGHAGAQNDLGVMYLRGDGVPRSVDQAIQWFRLAAKQGNELAISNLKDLNAPPSGWLYKCSNCGRVEKYQKKVKVSVCSQCIGVPADMQYLGPAY